jgi:hypothetical protein
VPTPCSEDIAEVVVKSRISTVSHDRHADVLDCVIGAAALMLDQTEQVQSLRITAIDGQDVTANPLRLRRASSALMGERSAEPSGDRRRPTAYHALRLSRTRFSAPLLSVHWTWITQSADTYPPLRENRRAAVTLRVGARFASC